MTSHRLRLFCWAMTALLAFNAVTFAESDADKEKKRRDLLEKMDKLRAQKDALKQKEKEKIDKIEEKSKVNRAESIRLFEQIIATTQKGDSRRCDALFQLGALYYDDERETYIQKQNRFQQQYAAWEKSGAMGSPPLEPISDFPKAINAYKELVLACPGFKNRDVALYKLGNIFTQVGNFEMAFESFLTLVKEFPKSENVPYSNLRIGEYYYMMRDNENALKYYKGVGMQSGADNYLLSLYRIASCYYNMSKFEKAIDNFFEYVELADSGKFKRADFRDEALEYMAISFSEMEGGAEMALEFFNKKGGRPYQDFVIYTIGIKNRDHDNVKEAVKSLNFLLQNYPNYIEAPMAMKALIDCYVIEKEYTESNNLREKLIKDYGPGSTWDKTYSASTERIKIVRENIKEAGAMIPIYYHKTATAQKDSGHVEKARELMNKAIQWYEKYIRTFPDEKWNNYTFHYFRADLLSDTLIGRDKEAAQEFDWVSREDTTRYPSRVQDKQKLEEDAKKEVRDIKKQYETDIKEKVATVQVDPEEAGFAAVVLKEKVAKQILKSRNLSDTSKAGFNLPEFQDYLNYIREYKNRFPTSQHAAEVAFLEANLHFDMGNYPMAVEGYKFVVTNFPNHEKVFKASLENLAKAQLKNKQYGDAIGMYKRLYHEYAATSAEKTQMVEAIAAAMFQVAESKQKAGDYAGAADQFKQIVIDYPDFSACDKALFNAGWAYEQGKQYAEAAREFERVFDKYVSSKLRKEAMFRASTAFKGGRFFDLAAQMQLKFASELPMDSQAVPSIFRAAFLYDSAGDYIQSAKTYERVYDLYLENKKDPKRYVTSDREAPGALYSAGLIYEKGKRYEDAIEVYKKLESVFPGSPFTPEAVYSIAICYEKMENDRKMTEAYLNFVGKYGGDKGKVVESLMKAARAYKRLGQKEDEEKMFRTIIDIQQKYGKSDQQTIDPAYAAESYFILGERDYEKYAEMDLRTSKTGKAGVEEVGKKLKAKTEAIPKILNYFAGCIDLKSDKWTTHAVFMCGELFWNLLEAVKNQPIIEKDPNKIAYAKVKVNEMLPEYYNKAMEYYYTNVAKFGSQVGFQDEWVAKSAEKYAQSWYQLGFSNVENGAIFSAAPNPFPKGTQEYDEYRNQIQSVIDKLVEKCVPVFESGIKACSEIYIDNSYVERMKQELARHSPDNPALKISVKEAPKPVSRAEAASSFTDEAYHRAMKKIAGIMDDKGVPIASRITMLQSMEAGAKREIERLKVEIAELKAK